MFNDTLKAFDNFKNKAKKSLGSNVFYMKNYVFLKVYSIQYI